MPRDNITQEVIDGLKKIYLNKLSHIEKDFKFSQFQYDAIADAELDAKPQVLVVGQYSVGKTTFVRYLLGEDFPCMVIGPEPTTDKFTAVMHGRESQAIQGHSVASIKELPFGGVTKLGADFLSKFELSLAPADVLKSITLIDTPGMLAGSTERLNRSYNYPESVKWFADRSDLILVMFDSHKFDISREMRETLKLLRGQEQKMRFMLNKSDQPSPGELIRVYGHLMWRLSGLIGAIESKYIYVGSFWDKRKDTWEVFERDEENLVTELYELPRSAAVRKINDFIKRIRMLKTHIRIVSYLRSRIPIALGRERTQHHLTQKLPEIFDKIKKFYSLTDGDMPDVEEFKKRLSLFNFLDFPIATKRTIKQLDSIIDQDIPHIFSKVNAITSLFKLRPVPQELRSQKSGRWEYQEIRPSVKHTPIFSSFGSNGRSVLEPSLKRSESNGSWLYEDDDDGDLEDILLHQNPKILQYLLLGFIFSFIMLIITCDVLVSAKNHGYLSPRMDSFVLQLQAFGDGFKKFIVEFGTPEQHTLTRTGGDIDVLDFA